MTSPDLEKIKSFAGRYSIVPIFREIYGDMITPVAVLKKLAQNSSQHFLLESVEGGVNWGRYSFLGYDPVMRVVCKNSTVRIIKGKTETIKKTDRPFDVLREIMGRYKAPILDEMPPYTGGFVGYFAYSMIKYREPKLKLDSGEFDDFDVMLFDKVIVFDHLRQKIMLFANVETSNPEENYRRASAQLDDIENIIRNTKPLFSEKTDDQPQFSCNMSKDEFCNMVDKAKKYIIDGDIFQVVLSRKFSSPFNESLINAYRVLRTTNPSPYMVYFTTNDVELICSSPETLIKLKDGQLATFPVAGSRPRGKTPKEDIDLEKDLLSDEKELAEHNMLVDLGRNDLGMISEFNSVKVTKYMAIHRYSKIMHICSQVEGKILPGYDAFNAIEAVLPAGTLSGAPKIRACEIIEELEPEPRGIYGGALGYIDFSGNMDTCIAIRMAVKRNGVVSVQAGAGIVADSVPEKEYEESGNKALAVINAILRAKEVIEP